MRYVETILQIDHFRVSKVWTGFKWLNWFWCFDNFPGGPVEPLEGPWRCLYQTLGATESAGDSEVYVYYGYMWSSQTVTVHMGACGCIAGGLNSFSVNGLLLRIILRSQRAESEPMLHCNTIMGDSLVYVFLPMGSVITHSLARGCFK